MQSLRKRLQACLISYETYTQHENPLPTTQELISGVPRFIKKNPILYLLM